MIKIHKNDSIVDVIIKIKHNNDKDVILEFPFWHPILHNYTSLKILKNKAWKKDLVIITSDKTAKKIWKSLGIKYSIANNPDVIEYNYSFFEYFIYTFKNYFIELKDLFLGRNDDGIIGKYSKKYDGKIWYFITAFFLSLLLLIFIFYFAVNKTYIYITPKIEVKYKAKNFIFTEMWEDDSVFADNIIKLKKIEKIISITDKFWTSWISSGSITNSRWKVTLSNYTDDKIDLVENTRLQTASWIVFLIEWSVSIPKTETWSWWEVIPWKIDVYAVSRNHDVDGKITWSRWNIEAWVSMILPWLDKENQVKIYAVSASKFEWSNDNYKKVITDNDIENAKILLKWKLEKEALEAVNQEIKKNNEINNVQYEILWTNDVIKFLDFEVYWADNYLEWQEMESFELSWTIKILTYTYNKNLVITKMRTTINNSILSNIEEILEINSSSLRIANVLSTQENPLSITATIQIEVSIIHNFLSQSNTHSDRLKVIIAWLPKDEAEKILLNNERVSNVKIEIKPFFINNISKINDNIIFKIVNK